MASCTGADVKAIIDTDLEAESAEMTNLIAEADQEITDRGMAARPALTKQYICKFLVAEQLAMKNPIPEKSIGDSTGHHAPEYYRAMAEKRMMQKVPEEIMPTAPLPWE